MNVPAVDGEWFLRLGPLGPLGPLGEYGAVCRLYGVCARLGVEGCDVSEGGVEVYAITESR